MRIHFTGSKEWIGIKLVAETDAEQVALDAFASQVGANTGQVTVNSLNMGCAAFTGYNEITFWPVMLSNQ